MPDKYKYYFKTSKESEQTINLIKQIPQDKRNGKYIIPCIWLREEHQVNLRIDFDNKIFEIVNTGASVDKEAINNLQKELRSNFKEDNWVVYENRIIQQSTGNCVIASSIVATEKVMLGELVKEYFKKKERLTTIEDEVLNLSRRKPSKKQSKKKEKEDSNTIINKNDKDRQQTVTVEELKQQVKSFLVRYNDKIEQIAINEILYNDLRKEIEELKKEKQGQVIIEEELLKKEVLQKKSIEDRIENIKQDKERLKIEKENFVRYNLILKERLFNKCDNQFNRELSEIIINKGVAIRVVK